MNTPAYEQPGGINTEAITWAVNALQERRLAYDLARQYYNGNHPLAFATDKFKNAFGKNFGSIKINLCQLVVDTIASRLKVNGFTLKLARAASGQVGGGQAGGQADTTAVPLEDEAADVWELNRMGTRISDVFSEALLCGDAYIIVWPDPEADNEPVFYPQDAGTCAVQYHPEKPGYIVRAAKWWIDAHQHVRLTIYTADRIEKYIARAQSVPIQQVSYYGRLDVLPVINQPGTALPTSAESFTRYVPTLDDGEPAEPWPLPNPWGKCPVFHFPNGKRRQSELKNLIDPQNALNKTTCDELVAMEFFAQPQRWAVGVEDEGEDEANAAQEMWKVAADRLWTVANDNAKFGQFDPSDPSSYLKVKADFRADMAIIAGIPPYHFDMTGEVPSGAALQILESRLNEKVEYLQGYWGTPLADLMLLALLMKRAIAGGAKVRLNTEWHDTAPKDTLSEAQTQVMKLQTGVSRRQSLREQGYAPQRIDEMQQERADESNIVPTPAQLAPAQLAPDVPAK